MRSRARGGRVPRGVRPLDVRAARVAVGTMAFAAVPMLAQPPRIAPPPPCRPPAGFTSALLNTRMPGAPTNLLVLPFTQGVVESRYANIPTLLAERVRNRLRATSGMTVLATGVTDRLVFEASGLRDSIRALAGAQWVLAGIIQPVGLETHVQVTLKNAKAATNTLAASWSLQRHSLTEIETRIADTVRVLVRGRGELAPPAPSVSRANEYTFAGAIVLLAGHSFAEADSARRALETIFRTDTGPAVAALLARATVETIARGSLNERDASAHQRRIDALTNYLLQRDSANAHAWTTRAIAARERDPQRMGGALDLHLRAVRNAPRSADALYQHGVTLTHMGRWAEAGTQFRRALAVEPGHPRSLVALARLEQRSGQAALVCALTNASIAADPYNPAAYSIRAVARTRLAQSRDAFADAETAVRLNDSPGARGLRLFIEGAVTNTDHSRVLAREIAKQYLSGGGTMRVDDAVSLARGFIATGFQREAVGAISRASPRGLWLATELAEPVFNPVRGLPGYSAIVDSLRPPK